VAFEGTEYLERGELKGKSRGTLGVNEGGEVILSGEVRLGRGDLWWSTVISASSCSATGQGSPERGLGRSARARSRSARGRRSRAVARRRSVRVQRSVAAGRGCAARGRRSRAVARRRSVRVQRSVAAGRGCA